jgi:peroxiredoxin
MGKLMIGQAAPVFSLPDINGREIALEDFLERTVLINFWSAECPWAERADRLLSDWQDRIVLLSIASNANEPPDLLRQVAAARGLQVVLLDKDHAVADRYDAVTTPHLFLIDGGGLLRYQGAFDDVNFRQREPTRNYTEEAIRALLKGEKVMVVETPAYGCTIVREIINQGSENSPDH